eukprot:CAMPEP_0182895170 /NCGR_PEP_ID=MMETSP0034_2-20130328/25525_1 /TAXON_ID=156128 /ORGANISM="Nephroselmis pyriformis, Strain CCMP717" /LENGTH=131 /DNA_ID=CAMNT_0025028991 /DNA_START=14 /DNA_END=409 /DNA_ORIENTATION=-
MGEAGRLQTQAIKGTPAPRKEVALTLAHLPARVVLEEPFFVTLRIENCTERGLGPLRVAFAQREVADKKIVISGAWDNVVDELPPKGSQQLRLCLVALAAGVHKLSGLSVLDARDSRPYDSLPVTDVQVFR